MKICDGLRRPTLPSTASSIEEIVGKGFVGLLPDSGTMFRKDDRDNGNPSR